MAYELLTGRTPFGDRPPAKLFVAHLSEKPENVAELRPDTPPGLAALVMQCLEKDPDRRPQSAAEILRSLDAVTSSSTNDVAPVIALATRRNLGRALAIYAVRFIAVAILSRAAIIVIGLPDWVFPGSLIVMALGLPVILFTGLVHHQAKLARTQATFTPGGNPTVHGTMTQIALKASPWMTWRRTAMGGVYSVGVFVAIVGVWMLLRALGIGPAGSLLAAGTLQQSGPILVSDFKRPASDTSLGSVMTEALRLAVSRQVVGRQHAYGAGDTQRGRQLLEEAVALDTGFAMAYRKLSVSYLNANGQAEKGYSLLQKAYDHRARLSDEERLSLEGYYFTRGLRPGANKGISACHARLEMAPENQTALINLGVQLEGRGEYANAEALFRRSLA